MLLVLIFLLIVIVLAGLIILAALTLLLRGSLPFFLASRAHLLLLPLLVWTGRSLGSLLLLVLVFVSRLVLLVPLSCRAVFSAALVVVVFVSLVAIVFLIIVVLAAFHIVDDFELVIKIFLI